MHYVITQSELRQTFFKGFLRDETGKSTTPKEILDDGKKIISEIVDHLPQATKGSLLQFRT